MSGTADFLGGLVRLEGFVAEPSRRLLAADARRGFLFNGEGLAFFDASASPECSPEISEPSALSSALSSWFEVKKSRLRGKVAIVVWWNWRNGRGATALVCIPRKAGVTTFCKGHRMASTVWP